ncbi:hypothetical protein DHD08_19320, partial [Arenibacter sp. H213]|nr:hypothetical protein [Arenibacter sp. H213]
IADDAVTAAMINANVAGAGITKNPGTGALEVDTSTLTGSGDISSTDITVTGGTNAAFADVTLEIADDAVTAAMINANVAGAGITKNPGTGALEVDTSTLTGSGDISSTDITVTGGANAAFANVTLEIADDAVTAAMINANVAGAGITKNPGTGALEVDTSTLTGSGDISSTDITVTGGANAAFADVTLDITTGAISNVHISSAAAIAGSKIAPDFGDQNIVTTGDLSAKDITATGQFYSNTDTIPSIPDYVFQKYFKGYSDLKEAYNFKSLAEIEAFVKQHHHLPGIKSAEEVKQDGFWNLSESNLQNLEKIEELFLHTIEQEKKIDQLKKENQSLSTALQSLRKDMEEIKALVQKNSRKN